MRAAPVALCILLVASTFLAALAPTRAATESSYVCGRVVNAAGWPLEGVLVTAVGHGTSSANDNPSHLPVGVTFSNSTVAAETDADGNFTLFLKKDAYSVVLRDPRGPTDASRAGAVYPPARLGVDHFNTTSVADACGEDKHGFRIGDAGNVTMPAPGQGFLSVTVRDAVAAGAPGLAGVDVGASPAADATRQAFAHQHTSDGGVARMACAAAGAQPVKTTLRLSKESYVEALRDAACAEGKEASYEFHLWREPVTLAVRVTGGEVAATTPAESPEQAPRGAKAPVAPPVEGAQVRVVSTPAALAPLHAAPASPMCGAAAAGPGVDHANQTPYACAAATDKHGAATLVLPWAEGDQPFAIHVVSPGFATGQNLTWIHASDVARPGADARDLPVLLQRPGVLVRATLVDARAAPIADATVGVVDAAGEEIFTALSDAEGAVALEIPTGSYTLRIAADGYNARTCSVTVDAADEGEGVLSRVSRPDCFRLIAAGMAIVEGRLVDKPTKAPVAGLDFWIGATRLTSGEDGGFVAEVNHSAPAPIGGAAVEGNYTYHGAASHWTLPSGGTKSPGLDVAQPLGDVELARVLRTAVVVAWNGTDPIPGADFAIRQDGALKSPAAGNRTGLDGRGAPVNLTWTTLEGSPQFDVSPYVAETFRHKTDETHHTALATVAFDLNATDAGRDVVVTMTEDGRVSTAVTATDMHTGAPLAGVEIRASITSPGNPPAVCGPVCATQAPGALVLYDNYLYQLCAVDPRYDAQAGCTAHGEEAGGARAFALQRKSNAYTVEVRDAHTGMPVQGAKVQLVLNASFACKPGDKAYASCSLVASPASTLVTGRTPSLTLPWFSADEGCFRVLAGAGTVVHRAAANNAVESEATSFQQAGLCGAPNGGGNLPIRPLRAGAYLNGTIDGPDARPVPGANVTVASERAAFECSPALHHTSGSFPQCSGADAAEDGKFSLLLPTGAGPGHAWTLTGNATGRFNESVSHARQTGAPLAATVAPAPVAPRMTLWPLAFDVAVTVVDQDATGAPHPCEQPVGIVLFDVETRLSYPATAVPAEGGACVARATIPGWNRASQTMPLGGQTWGKEADLFVVLADAPRHVGAQVALLGPKARNATLSLVHVHATVPAGAPGVVTGHVHDANATQPAVGVPGAKVTATLVEGRCATGANSATATAGANGTFAFAVPCPGRYDVVATGPGGLYLDAPGVVVDVADGQTREVGLTLPRALATLTVLVRDLAATPAPGPVNDAWVKVAGQDVVAGPAPKRTNATGEATFAVPWGAYAIQVQTPSGGYLTLTPTLAAFVQPGAPQVTTAYAVKTA